MRLICRSRNLVSSPASSRGSRNIEASSSIIRSASRARNSPEIVIDSRPALADREPPTESMASAKSAALRSPAPFSITPASRLASPAWPSGSLTAPPRITACRPISGTSCFSISTMLAPFSSSTWRTAGSVTPCAALTDAAIQAHKARQPRRSCFIRCPPASLPVIRQRSYCCCERLLRQPREDFPH